MDHRAHLAQPSYQIVQFVVTAASSALTRTDHQAIVMTPFEANELLLTVQRTKKITFCLLAPRSHGGLLLQISRRYTMWAVTFHLMAGGAGVLVYTLPPFQEPSQFGVSSPDAPVQSLRDPHFSCSCARNARNARNACNARLHSRK
jgi:hypothetical protein